MSSVNRVTQVLHEEHRATIALMERIETLIARHRPGNPPDTGERAVAQLLSEIPAAVAGEIDRHFAFEENFLFTYLADLGDGMIGAHLSSEHSAMRPLGTQIVELARAAKGGFDEATWNDFRRSAQEFAERMLAHVQKEEMALLPLLEEVMDPETDARLVQEYLEAV